MDNFENNESQLNESTGEEPETPQVDELSHSDKMIGIFTEPKTTFEKTALFPPKTVDWILPIILLLIFVIISQFIIYSNPEVSYQMEQKQREAINKMVEEGTLTQEQADQSFEAQQQFTTGATGGIIRSVSILIFGFIVFFIVTGIYFLFSKFVLKGEGSYTSALVANGLTAYIGIVAVILVTILSIAMGRMVQDVSVASLMGMERTSFGGWILSFIDVITIWSYVVLSIGLAKMFKSDSVGKYYIMVFGLWFVWKLLMFVAGDAVPFLRGM